MPHTTVVRFLEPIDPRMVWTRVETLVNASEGYLVAHHAARDEAINAPNPSIWADPDQGVDAWARMYYGHEGSPLIEDDGDPCPVAYVELRLDTSHDEDNAVMQLHQRYVHALWWWSPVPIAWRDDGRETWTTAAAVPAV